MLLARQRGRTVWKLRGQRTRVPAHAARRGSFALPHLDTRTLVLVALALTVRGGVLASCGAPPRSPIHAADELAPPGDPERWIRGVVAASDGSRIGGADVALVRTPSRQLPGLVAMRERADRERVVARTRTDERGDFRFAAAAGDEFDVVVDVPERARVRLANVRSGEDVRVALTRGAVLVGRVVALEDGEPLAGAVVTARSGIVDSPGAQVTQAVSDERGRFRLDRLPADAIRLDVEACGRALAHVRSPSLQAGEARTLELRVDAGARLRGRVTDGITHAPIAGACVGERTRDSACWVRANADGVFELRGLSRGAGTSNAIVVCAPGYGEFDAHFDGVADEEIEHDFFLLPAHRARGRIVDERGIPIGGADIAAITDTVAYGCSQHDARRARSATDGTFSLDDLRPDLRHTLLVHADGHAAGVFDFPAREFDEHDLDLGDVALEGECSLSGRVLDSGGDPRAELWVLLEGDPARRDSLGPVAEGGDGYVRGEGFGFGRVMARTDARGRFVFRALPAGHYALSAGIKGSVLRANRELELAPSERRDDFDLAFDAVSGIDGRVVDLAGAAVEGAWLELIGETSADALARTLSLARGAFHFDGVPAGRYTIVVSCDEFAARLPGAPLLGVARITDVAAGARDVVVSLPPR